MTNWIARALLLSLILPPRAATAQEPEREVVASDRAVQLGRLALQKYARHAWQEAYAELEAADRLAHSPVFLLYMARCERELGHLLASQALYEAVVTERLGPGAPRVLHEAGDAARAELLELRAKIPTIVLTTKPRLAPSVPLLIRVDGEALAERRLSMSIEMDPGRHDIEVAAAGLHGLVVVEPRPGQLGIPVEVTLSGSSTLAAHDAAAVRAPQVPLSRSAVPRRAAAAPFDSSIGWPPLVAFAVGTAGLVVGAVSGVVAWSEMRSLRADCPGDACRPSDEHRRDNVRALADVSTVGFVAGGLGIGAGLTIMLAVPASKPAPNVRGLTPVAALSLQGDL